MKKENQIKTKERVLSLIESGLAEKTVNNWRRDRSASYMKMLPQLAEKFGVNITELLDIPLRGDTSELSEEELHLLLLYRKSRVLPQGMRSALRETLETTIKLYIDTAKELSEPKKKN